MTLSVLVLAFLTQTHSLALSLGYGQPSAVLWKDQLFVAASEVYFNSYSTASMVLYRGSFELTRRPVHHPTIYGQGDWGGESALLGGQAKLEIKGDRILWFEAGTRPVTLPMSDLQYLEANEFGKELCSKRRDYQQQHLLVEYRSGSVPALLFPVHRKPDVPEPPIPVPNGTEQSEIATRAYRQWDYQARARIDLQLAGEDSVRLFHAYKDTIYVSTEPNYRAEVHWDPKTFQGKKKMPAPPERQLRTGKLPKDFTEHFAAYTAGGRDYLVTKNGKLYAATTTVLPVVEVTALWIDPTRPLRGVVQDQESGAVYGWGYAGTNGSPNRFYLKFDPKPVAAAYKVTVPMWHEPMDAYLESYECARAFRKDAEKK